MCSWTRKLLTTPTTATTEGTVIVVGKVGMECLYIRDGYHESITYVGSCYVR